MKFIVLIALIVAVSAVTVTVTAPGGCDAAVERMVSNAFSNSNGTCSLSACSFSVSANATVETFTCTIAWTIPTTDNQQLQNTHLHYPAGKYYLGGGGATGPNFPVTATAAGSQTVTALAVPLISTYYAAGSRLYLNFHLNAGTLNAAGGFAALLSGATSMVPVAGIMVLAVLALLF